MTAHALNAAALAILLGVAAAGAAGSAYELERSQSRLEFVATQAGADFTGSFSEFAADIRFDPQQLDASRFDVRIDTGSVDTQDRDRDEIIRGPDLFDVTAYPQARYVAERFEAADQGYVAHGELTLRGETREVPVQFTFERDGADARLHGSTTIERLDFGVGQGEWRDTEWVGNEVRIRFDLVLATQAGG